MSEIMEEVGLAVGGIYKHFVSREALAAEAVSVAFANTADWNERASRQLGEAIEEYLSPAQHDDLAPCPVFSLLTAEHPERQRNNA
nr:TetR family transcriptional regulator [Paraburkholderia silviterrae]